MSNKDKTTKEARSSTDILLELEQKLDTLGKRFQVIEHLQKIILGKLNAKVDVAPTLQKTEVKNVNPSVVNKDNFEQRPKTSSFADLAAQHGVKVEDDVTTDLIEAVDTREVSVRGSRGPVIKHSGQKKNVIQYVRFPDGKPILLASIEILDLNDEILNRTRTNTKGSWKAPLLPGIYKIHLLKNYLGDDSKKPIDLTYEIEVSDDEETSVTLPPITLE